MRGLAAVAVGRRDHVVHHDHRLAEAPVLREPAGAAAVPGGVQPAPGQVVRDAQRLLEGDPHLPGHLLGLALAEAYRALRLALPLPADAAARGGLAGQHAGDQDPRHLLGVGDGTGELHAAGVHHHADPAGLRLCVALAPVARAEQRHAVQLDADGREQPVRAAESRVPAPHAARVRALHAVLRAHAERAARPLRKLAALRAHQLPHQRHHGQPIHVREGGGREEHHARDDCHGHADLRSRGRAVLLSRPHALHHQDARGARHSVEALRYAVLADAVLLAAAPEARRDDPPAHHPHHRLHPARLRAGPTRLRGGGGLARGRVHLQEPVAELARLPLRCRVRFQCAAWLSHRLCRRWRC